MRVPGLGRYPLTVVSCAFYLGFFLLTRLGYWFKPFTLLFWLWPYPCFLALQALLPDWGLGHAVVWALGFVAVVCVARRLEGWHSEYPLRPAERLVQATLINLFTLSGITLLPYLVAIFMGWPRGE